ncbi:MAG TPA: hypothetical protein VGB66_08070, partial [Longimicrobium sp.]
AIRRAAEAGAWLDTLARDHSPVVVVTHGVFRRLLARGLVARGWKLASGRRRYAHWSAWHLTRPS